MARNKKIEMTQSEKQKLFLAETKLLECMPHFRPLLNAVLKAGIYITENPEHPRACTYPNGTTELNRDFLASLTPDETAFILAHEMGHHYLDTFGREGKNDGTPDYHRRVNIASDTLINHMVNRYFMAAGLGDFSTPQSQLHRGMWWDPNRYYSRGSIIPKDTLETMQASRKGSADDATDLVSAMEETPMLLDIACRKAMVRWVDVQDATMEYVLYALTMLERLRVKNQERHLVHWAVSGNVRVEAPEGAPLPWPVMLDFPRTDANDNSLSFKGAVSARWNHAPAGAATPALTLHLWLLSKTRSTTREIKCPLTLEPTDPNQTTLSEGQALTYHETEELRAEGWKAQLTLTRDDCQKLTMEGTVTLVPNLGTDIGGITVSGTSPCSGDCRSLNELRRGHPELSDADISRLMKEIDKARSYAARNAPNPQALDLEVRRECYRIPWENLLQKWFDETFVTKRDWNRASRRGERNDGVCLPGRSRYGFLLNVILDTSGSMRMPQLSKALTAISQFCSQNNIDSIRILECDDHLQDVKTITAQDLKHYSFKGHGGTDMTPAMERFAQDPQVTAVVILTDGRNVDHPQACPPYDVLWAIVGGHCTTNFRYGTVMPIEP